MVSFLKSLFHNTLLSAVLGLVWFLMVWNPSVQWLFWSPPKTARLTFAEGVFLPRAEMKCESGYCAFPAYRFRTVGGKVLNMSCEPWPEWNNCLSATEPYGTNKLISNVPARIEYFTDHTDSNSNLLMSVKFSPDPSLNRKDMSLDFDARLAQIRATVVRTYRPQMRSPDKDKYKNDGLRRPGWGRIYVDILFSAFILFVFVRFLDVGNLFRKKQRALK